MYLLPISSVAAGKCGLNLLRSTYDANESLYFHVIEKLVQNVMIIHAQFLFYFFFC